jgi:hypothetical protein
MDRRLALDEVLNSIPGVNVYYQPPESVRMKYPAIRYTRSNITTTYADNKPYLSDTSYMLTVIDKRPDSPIVKIVAALPKCRHTSHYTVNNLHHDTFTIFD